MQIGGFNPISTSYATYNTLQQVRTPQESGSDDEHNKSLHATQHVAGTENEKQAQEKKQGQKILGEKGDDKEAKNDGAKQLTEEEQKQVEDLQERDREVRAHEQAHKAAAGSLAKGGINFEYQKGPDGKSYAVGGNVNIDTSAVPGDPEATIQKAQRIRAAALAPADPSSTDRAVAADASNMAAQARQELLQQQREESEKIAEKASAPAVGAAKQDDDEEDKPAGNKNSINAYKSVSSLETTLGRRQQVDYVT